MKPRSPTLRPDALKAVQAPLADADTCAHLNVPDQLIDDWHAVAVQAVGEAVANHRGLAVWMDSCMKCGACTDKCHYFLGSGDPKNMPVARQELFRGVYRRYHTFWGKLLPKWVGATDLTEAMLDDWYTYFHQCSQCRRCAVFCPVGIDTAEFAMAGRHILSKIGKSQAFTSTIVDKALRLGNNLGLPQPALEDTLAALEEEVSEDTGESVRFPIDENGAEVLLVTPSADFFAEPHVDGLIGYAKVLHQAGVSWTVSSVACEAANFALFHGDQAQMAVLAKRIRQAALDLGVKQIAIGECGHAWRVAYSYLEALAGPLSFLDARYPRAQHIVEVTHRLWRAGALRLNPAANAERIVTFHDSCNVARGARLGNQVGGQFDLPRELLKASCPKFVEMRSDTIRETTFCCGAGAGLLADDGLAVRVAGAQPRMEAYRDVVANQGVTHLAAMCAICKSQLAQMCQAYGLDRHGVVSVHQLIGDALVMG